MKSWWSVGGRALLLLAAAILAGLASGHAALALSLALLALLAQQLYVQWRVLRWLRGDRADAAPDAGGAWGEIVGLVLRLMRRKQYHKHRMLQLLRELRTSTAAIPDGVVMLNPAAEILWFNRAAGHLLQLQGRKDVGLRVDNLVRNPEFVAHLRGADYSTPVVVRGAGVDERFLHFQVVPYGAGQRLLLVRDVTKEARLEQMRRDFVANASHELRSPLTVIAGYLETLAADESIDPGIRPPILEMQRQSQRMGAVVRDLLELSRLEADGPADPAEPIAIAGLLARLRADHAARMAGVGARLEVRVDSDDQLLGDEAQVYSAFSNLIENAAKYTPAGGLVDVHWWSDAEGGHLAVRDTGIGIPAEHIPRLTERFYRVDTGRSRASGGSGLGLAIVKHVLQRHGAHLGIESVEGRGSTFSCHFPPGIVRRASHERNRETL